MPKTNLGKWSVWLIVIFFGLFFLSQIVVVVGRTQGAFEPERATVYKILMPVIIIPASISGVAAFLTGVVSIIKHKERSWSVFITATIGFLTLIFALGEFLFSH